MNAVNPNSISLEEMRRISIQDLMKLELASLQGLQRKAEAAFSAARRAQSWIDGVIALKLCEQSKNENNK